MDLTGRKVLITGANRGRGAAFASAALSLDGWLAGQRTIWPDRFAELVRDTVGEPFRALLDEPRQVMTAVHEAFRDSTATN
jgi:NAD(P)-dependent dehydrogenase (short-subunit alcohol dehydrogenase family)